MNSVASSPILAYNGIMKKGILKFNLDRCKGCGLCVSICPQKIPKIHEKEVNVMGYHPISVSDMEGCIGCANCAVICPDGVIYVYAEERLGK